VYDSNGRRVRRVTEVYASAGAAEPERVEQVTYAGTLEVTRTWAGSPRGRPAAEWHAAHVPGPGFDLARWVAWVAGAPDFVPASGMRFPLIDVVGSVVAELDAAGDAVTRTEYLPYGAEARSVASSPVDEEVMRWRYSGKERDGRAGLYYYGARHYAPGQMRWTSPDPAGPADSLNPFAYGQDNPTTLADSDGRVSIHHWNVKDKNTVGINESGFKGELVAFLDKVSWDDKEGTVVFLTELMNTVTQVHLNTLLTELNKKTRVQWTGQIITGGRSQGNGRLENVAILTTGIQNPEYWKIVKPEYSEQTVMVPYNNSQQHWGNDRHIVAVTFNANLSGETKRLSIGGFHNLGPSSGGPARAPYWLGQAKRHKLSAVIGDWNVEPHEESAQATERSRTRRGDARRYTRHSHASSRGGSLYDYALPFNTDVDGRVLTVKNTTGSRGASSDHAQSSATLGTRKRRREE
jgi:RHS repeat-associated protein